MVSTLNLYIDDSGTRHPDKKQGKKPKHGHDYFALGGILIKDEEETLYEENYDLFCKEWQIKDPLHSSEIRSKAKNFSFIAGLSKKKQDLFYEQLYQLMKESPVVGVACVIDRIGYKNRYEDIYGDNKWKLCKTAFSIVVERAAKFAHMQDRKLRVNIERCDKKTDNIIKNYYYSLKQEGLPFSKDNSKKYNPMEQDKLDEILYDFKLKYKSSHLTQLADLYLWPMCMGGYDKSNRPYKRLLDDNKLINTHVAEEKIEHLGIKYFCWETSK